MGLYNQSLNENIDNVQVNNKVGSGSGSSSWAELQGKPFETIGDGLVVHNNQLVAHGYHDYSEDEQIVGTWFNKTLYSKCVRFNAPRNNFSWNERVIELESNCHIQFFIPQMYVRESYIDNQYSRVYNVFDNYVNVRIGSGYAPIENGLALILYTKE